MKKHFLVLIIVCSALLVCAEEIHLKDGTKISGQIVGVSGDKFQIKTTYGDMQVPRSEIVSIDFPENRPKDTEAATPVYDQALEGTTYINRSENIQITVPSGWALGPEFLSKDIHGGLKSADETQFLFITPEKFVGTLETYSVVVETQLKGRFKDFEKIAEFPATLDGRPARRMIMHGKSGKNETPLKFLVYMVSYEGKVVRLSFGTFEALFDKALPDFEKMAASYKTISTAKK